MNRAERKRADAFIADYQASIYNNSKMLELEEKLQLLQNSFEAHSPVMNGLPLGNRADRDQRLADYITKKERLEKEYDSLSASGIRVNQIMGYMPDEWAKLIKDLYGGKKTSGACADEIGYTRAGMYYHLKLEILMALDDYYALK